MRLTKGADVYSAQGEKLGTLDRVVIDPDSKEVTHLVISKGGLFQTDKVVAIDMLNRDVEDNIRLLNPKHDIQEFQDFEETQYINADEVDYPASDAQAFYWYPPVSLAWWRVGMDMPQPYAPRPTYVPSTRQNIPEGTVALEENAKVYSRDGKHVGNIEQVIVDSQDNRVTHFVVNEGLLFKERKLVPVLWITNINEDEVHLSTSSKVLDRLPAYQAAK